MQQLEEFANWLNDRDAEWWPFLFLRPLQHERMSSLRVLALAVLYGTPAGLVADLWLSLAAGASRPHMLFAPLVATAALFVAYRLTLARAWNRRAARVSVQARRMDALRSAEASSKGRDSSPPT